MPTAKELTADSQELMVDLFNKTAELTQATLSAAADAQLKALNQWFGAMAGSRALQESAQALGKSAGRMQSGAVAATESAVSAAEPPGRVSRIAERLGGTHWSTIALTAVPTLILISVPLLLLRKSFRQGVAEKATQVYERAGETYERAKEKFQREPDRSQREPESSPLSQPLPEHR